MESKINNFRIHVLDGFRAIAIVMVLLFHYFSRWPLLYAYGDKYDFFTYGKMGVQFFFIISGFVILYTLENTNNFIEFWKNRIIRLLPTMFIASLLTYFFVNFFDTELLFPTSHFFKNILASLTFIPPDTLASIFELNQLDYISGSYWSLWPEIQFYFFVSIIYFFNKNKFSIIFLGLSVLLIILNCLLPGMESVLTNKIKSFFIVFNLIESLPYFCFGVLFYLLYKNKMFERAIPVYLLLSFIGLVSFQIYVGYSNPMKLGMFFVFLSLFIMLIYFPELIRFLENKLFLKIGISSYFLYLIHENIGVLLINKCAVIFKSYQFVFSLILIFVMLILSILYTDNIERKVNKYLKINFFNSKKTV
jgi:peptidoglycan/LPS O-acetylase OafA/YrhL